MAGADLYDAEWREYSRRFLRANPACVLCGQRAAVTDHVKPHRGDRALFNDPANHQPLCRACHGRKTARHDGGFGNPRDRGERPAP